jgi:Rps23 Pro-64 3,4-dihydroxylase Tpa1-like proline 4-hydroxylase
MIKFKSIELCTYPWPHLLGQIELEFSYENLKKWLEDEPKENFQITHTDNFQKKELRHSYGDMGKVLSLMCSENIVSMSEQMFSLKNLQTDQTFDGGGVVITEEGGYLRYHNDFPYSSPRGLYRVVNTLMYLNSPNSLVGGDLHLLDPNSKTVEKIIKPDYGVFVAFPTSKQTPHGHSRILKGERISINSYLYRDSPLDDRVTPSKTEWI